MWIVLWQSKKRARCLILSSFHLYIGIHRSPVGATSEICILPGLLYRPNRNLG